MNETPKPELLRLDVSFGHYDLIGNPEKVPAAKLIVEVAYHGLDDTDPISAVLAIAALVQAQARSIKVSDMQEVHPPQADGDSAPPTQNQSLAQLFNELGIHGKTE